MHPSVTIGSGGKRKPETVEFYNSTKYGVDVDDQMSRKFTVKAGCRRWPVHVFYNVLDLAAINAWILYNEVNKTSLSRRDFILQLANELRVNYVESRRSVNTVQTTACTVQSGSQKRRHCQIARCNGNKTTHVCAKCAKTVCKSCASMLKIEAICALCAE